MRIKDESEGEKRATALLMAIEDSDGNDMSVLDDNLDNIEDIDNMNKRNVNGACDSTEGGEEGKRSKNIVSKEYGFKVRVPVFQILLRDEVGALRLQKNSRTNPLQ